MTLKLGTEIPGTSAEHHVVRDVGACFQLGHGRALDVGDGRHPQCGDVAPVSYTHLTLPTIYSV